MKTVGILLSAGRQQFLGESLASLQRQTKKASEVYLIKDFSAPLDPNLDLADVKVIETPITKRGRGWTYAFEFALSQVPDWADYFFVMHDDDILEPSYVEKMQRAGVLYTNANVLSCSLKHIDEYGKTLPLQPFQFPETQLSTSQDVAFHYLHRCIPFPSCFYKNHPKNRKVLHHQLGSFADGLFLAQYAGEGTAVILQETLYRYRNHPAQVSRHPPAELENKFFQLLETVIKNKKARKKFRQKLLHRQYTFQYESGRRNKNASRFIKWFFSHSINEKLFLLSSPKRSFQFLKTILRYLLENASSQNL